MRNYTFEDVHFDFDRYTLRPEATRVLDEAVAALHDDPTLRIQIEGHTCNIGTAEYNLALGDRRANAVRDYLVSRGVAADRLHDDQLRRRAAEIRQRARGNAPAESPRRAHRQPHALGTESNLRNRTAEHAEFAEPIWVSAISAVSAVDGNQPLVQAICVSFTSI